MIVLLDSSLAGVDYAHPQNMAAVENLVTAYMEGKHYVLADRATAQHLYDQGGLGQRASAGLRRIYSRATENRAMLSAISRYVKVMSDGPVYSNGNTLHVPLSEFARSEAVSKTTLLAENVLDCEVLEFAAEHFAIQNGIRGLTLSIRRQGGGGSTIAMEFDNLCKNREGPVLCVTDGDRLCPSNGPSRTSKKCTRIAARTSWLAEHVDLELREIENIIPLELVEDSTDAPEAAEVVCRVQDERCGSALGYWDAKKGVTVRWVLSLPKGSREQEFWFQHLRCLMDVSGTGSGCIDEDACQHAPCRCVLIPGLGQATLARVKDHLGMSSRHRTLKRIRTNIRHWLLIGQIVFEWGCAPEAVRV